jgi:hypothetical protein
MDKQEIINQLISLKAYFHNTKDEEALNSAIELIKNEKLTRKDKQFYFVDGFLLCLQLVEGSFKNILASSNDIEDVDNAMKMNIEILEKALKSFIQQGNTDGE